MSGPREAVVSALVRAALTGMEEIQGSTSDEILSACFTLTRQIMAIVLEISPSSRLVIKGALESLLMDCAESGGKLN